MTFLDALKQAANSGHVETRIYRDNGPRLILDELGQIKMENDCLYLGDVFDFDDWQIEEAYDPMNDFNYVGSPHHY